MELVVSGLAVRRGDRRLFEGLSFSLSPGEAMLVRGANGAGKTSLLRAVAGLLRPEAGDIERPVALHLMGHQDGLKAARTAEEELAFLTAWSGADEAGLDRAIRELRLRPLLPLQVRVLSAGQRRRLAMARLIAAPRPLWLLDEPLAPLDADWREAFGRLATRHLGTGGMILAAAHDPLPVPTRGLELGRTA